MTNWTITIKEMRDELQERKEILEKLSWKEPAWSEPLPISNRMKGTTTHGVYRIIYKPSMKTMAIGEGMVSSRKARHNTVFRNNGESVAHEGGTSSPCAVATKMFKYDNDINNWLFSFCKVDKSIKVMYEKQLIKAEQPKFNLQGMAGK